MTRTVKEWIGKGDDEPVPPRVKLRVLERYSRQCAWCGNVITGRHETDHTIALANGGENRENNLQPLHELCHTEKTGKDVAQKSKSARVMKRHYGLHERKGRPIPSRPFDKRHRPLRPITRGERRT